MAQDNVALLEFRGNPNIGLYVFANNKFCIVGEEITDDKKKQIEEVLGVPVYNMRVLDTSLVGVFIAGNDDFLLVPPLEDKEMEKLQEITSEHEVELITLSHNINTFGNNFCVGDEEIIANSDYGEEFLQTVADKTEANIIMLYGEDLTAAGALCRYANDAYFFSQELEEENFSQMPENVKGAGSVNSGSMYISSGIVGNVNGILIGSQTSTVEIQNITESLEYI